MADVNVTLNKSGDSVTYEGYVLNACSNNDQVSDGSWSPTSNQTGMTVSASGSSITITNSNTSSSDASSIFTWTSSKLSNCSKTLSVTAKGIKMRTIHFTLSGTCDLVYKNGYDCGDSGSAVDLDWTVKCDNLTQLEWYGSFVAMATGSNPNYDDYRTIEDIYGDTYPSGVITVNMPIGPILDSSSFSISFGGSASGGKTFTGRESACSTSSSVYVYDDNLTASGYFYLTSNDHDQIFIDLNIS